MSFGTRTAWESYPQQSSSFLSSTVQWGWTMPSASKDWYKEPERFRARLLCTNQQSSRRKHSCLSNYLLPDSLGRLAPAAVAQSYCNCYAMEVHREEDSHHSYFPQKSQIDPSGLEFYLISRCVPRWRLPRSSIQLVERGFHLSRSCKKVPNSLIASGLRTLPEMVCDKFSARMWLKFPISGGISQLNWLKEKSMPDMMERILALQE